MNWDERRGSRRNGDFGLTLSTKCPVCGSVLLAPCGKGEREGQGRLNGREEMIINKTWEGRERGKYRAEEKTMGLDVEDVRDS